MGFESVHPAVNLIFYAAVITGSIAFDHPVFLLIAFLSSFAYSVRRKGRRGLVFNLCLLPVMIILALGYSLTHHFGVTVLSHDFIGNNMTAESLIYGLVIAARLAAVVMWCESLFSVVSSDKIVYLFGRLSPRLTFFLSVFLRFIPRLGREAGRIDLAQQGIGRGSCQGKWHSRLVNRLRIFSMLLTWTIDALSLEADSMKSRGSLLRGRTAFSIYRFDNRDRLLVVVLFSEIIITVMGWILGAANLFYSPVIIWRAYDAADAMTAVGYAALCLLPLGLETGMDFHFRRAEKKMSVSD